MTDIPSELREFHRDLMQDLTRDAHAAGDYLEDTFFRYATQQLSDNGEIEAAERAKYEANKGIQVDGYEGDPAFLNGVLTLFVLEWSGPGEVSVLTAGAMALAFKRANAFLAKAMIPAFRNSLEETSPAFGLADMIAASWSSVQKIRIVLLTDHLLSARIDGFPAGDFQGARVVHSVWDLGRFYRIASGKQREEIVVDMAEFGGSISALPAHIPDAGYEAYLAVIRGKQLAEIYDKWGARLLEQNVRVFLQARGGVNKGIRNTLEDEPEMFLAYNNGITATADRVVAERGPNGLMITRIDNLQIVNGGQTTASIHASSRKGGAKLESVFVQMKLSVIAQGRAEVVVPKISEYANSQNRINAADFFSNHPFHLRIKEFSQRLYAPSPDGSFRETKWFYERARGQYLDERNRGSVSEKRKFDMEYPKSQVFTKTDLAKVHVAWGGAPYIVSKGAQKNFAYFAEEIGKEWEKTPDVFNELYFRSSVVRLLLFKIVERLVSSRHWYEGGYRAQLVAYTVAKFATDVERMHGGLDCEKLWKLQGPTEAVEDALLLVLESIRDTVTNPPPGSVRNVTEWAKQQACWARVSAIEVVYPPSLQNDLLTRAGRREVKRESLKEQKMVNGIEAQAAVVNAGPDSWKAVREWGTHKKLLSEKELDLLQVGARIPNVIPSEKQALAILAILKRLRAEGFSLLPVLE